MTQVRRADRVARLIQDELSRVVLKDVKDSRVQSVTFTRVEMSSDLRRGTIFFVPLGALGDDARVTSLKVGLDSARKFMEQRVFKNLRLRSKPTFTFKYDSGVQNLVEVHDVLSKLMPSAPPTTSDEAAEASAEEVD
jgi:ribosome-binding factor A